MERFLKEERQQRILELLQERKRVTVPELSRQFGISEVTIRRDLHELAANGRLMRAHRGALEALPAPPEPPVVQRMSLEPESKEQIARAAAAFVRDGEAIFIGSGSTTTRMARNLAGRKRLTIVTNALNIAAELARAEDEITVVVIGGVLRGSELSVLGHIAEQSLQEMRVDQIFMGVQALSLDGGWTTDHLPEVSTTRRILEMARNLIVLADSSKIGKKAAALIAPIQRITTLVTDAAAPAEFVEALRHMGIQVIVAD
jgi:DeoR/GlpR family transcriptional regulator of sugar metabolism